MKKSDWITWGIIIAVIVFAFFIMYKPTPTTSKEIAECIGKEATLYVQLGCHACETQEESFGENYQYLNTVDCFYERDKCEGITATPTWVIGSKKIVGVQSIENLQDLTGC